MVVRIILSIAFLFAGLSLLAQSKEELQNQKQKAFDEIKLARELMEKTSREKAGSIQQLRILQKGIDSRSRLIKALEKEIWILEGEIAATGREIKELEIKQKGNREEYARLIYYAYRNHSSYEEVMYILAGESISQSYQRYKYLKYLSDYRVRKAAEIEAMMKELEEKRAELEKLRSNKVSSLEEKDREQNSLVVQRREKNNMIVGLRRQENKLKKEIQEKERIARELEAKIREIIEAEAKKASADNIYAALTPEQELVGKDFQKNKGKLPWPVERGIVTIAYGDYEVEGLVGSSVKNSGIDIDSAPGTRVRAVFDGEVTKVFAILGANYTVLVRHGAYLSVYNNLVNVRVKTGDKVLTKEVLGEAFVDKTDNVARMHFEVWKDRTNLNPELWISK